MVALFGFLVYDVLHAKRPSLLVRLLDLSVCSVGCVAVLVVVYPTWDGVLTSGD